MNVVLDACAVITYEICVKFSSFGDGSDGGGEGVPR